MFFVTKRRSRLSAPRRLLLTGTVKLCPAGSNLYTMTLTYTLLAILFYSLWALAEYAERKSRKWYRDRMMLRAAGYAFALANIMTALAICL